MITAGTILYKGEDILLDMPITDSSGNSVLYEDLTIIKVEVVDSRGLTFEITQYGVGSTVNHMQVEIEKEISIQLSSGYFDVFIHLDASNISFSDGLFRDIKKVSGLYIGAKADCAPSLKLDYIIQFSESIFNPTIFNSLIFT